MSPTRTRPRESSPWPRRNAAGGPAGRRTPSRWQAAQGPAERLPRRGVVRPAAVFDRDAPGPAPAEGRDREQAVPPGARARAPAEEAARGAGGSGPAAPGAAGVSP
ncbi:hypothetical protein GCM10010259_66490 [Streptomyces daghestanicus]|uniref:Uncharacterized protein n=1 Tax=Streptomyces daghestanicus TaxID=66885 RepID=A0ABQ3Q841_9ACTN|nr:hypothetical protein GCM10010240_67260 [Streptomyces griseoviridis]GGU66940.1 hypothetical protein GCM10010259_66490 [Streptomyces daghestanicus]GHI33449.1 hypothetical protein Sdagh_51790 [Streptomyces daghestanicus]